jgi:hypothetical protein
LSFREYDIEPYFSSLAIYDGNSTLDVDLNTLDALSTSTISSTSGQMLIVWNSDNLGMLYAFL